MLIPEPDPSSSKRGAKGIRAAAQEDVVNKATKVLANSRKRRKVELQQSVDPVRSDDDAESAAASSSRKPKGAQALDTAATKKRVMSKPGPDEKNSRKKGRPQVLADVESAQELSDEEEEVAKPVEGRKPKAAASGKDAKTKPATRRKATKSDDRALLDKVCVTLS